MTKRFIIILLVTRLIPGNAYSQKNQLWSDSDRKFLVDNLERTKLEITRQTQQLSLAQWSYKEDSTKWSIGQVLEHLGLYERIFAQEADIMLSARPEPVSYSLSLPDSSYINWKNDPGPHKAEWNAEPSGFIEGSNNLTYFLFRRNHIIDFIKTTTYDLKARFTYRWGKEQRRSIHALMVVHFGHTDRHIKQIDRIKHAAGFPK
jgi:hypothetical protein